MNQIDYALLQSTKRALVKKKATAVRTRVILGDLTIDEAGMELKVYMDKLGRFRSLEELDKWLNGRQNQNQQS